MSLTLEQFGFDRLPPQQRLELIGLLWDSLADAPFTPPDSHLRELENASPPPMRTRAPPSLGRRC